MKDGRNEFPVRLDEKALIEIANRANDNTMFISAMHTLPVQQDGGELSRTYRTLSAFHSYLLERRVDPGFQVVIGE